MYTLQSNNPPIYAKATAGAKSTASTTPTTQFNDSQIAEMLAGYINIAPELWDYIPKGSHIRYFRAGDEPRTERFRPGGFVKEHRDAETGRTIILENQPSGGPGYIMFPLVRDSVAEIWKKYSRDAYIELHLVFNSLARKNKQYEDLERRVGVLENVLRGLVAQDKK